MTVTFAHRKIIYGFKTNFNLIMSPKSSYFCNQNPSQVWNLTQSELQSKRKEKVRRRLEGMFTTQRCHQQHLMKCLRGELTKVTSKLYTPGYSKLISERRKIVKSNGSCGSRVICEGTLFLDGPQKSSRCPRHKFNEQQGTEIVTDLQTTPPEDHKIYDKIGADNNNRSTKTFSL